MKTREVEYGQLLNWEDRLDTAYHILAEQRKNGGWTTVCDEALQDLNAVHREIVCVTFS